jgi:hypothetical protein
MINALKTWNNKNDLVDPLSAIIKLYIYNYMDNGTKIIINDNKITYNNPGIFQYPVRRLYGHGKNDINIIFNPIMYACDVYLKLDIKEKYYNLFDGASNALLKLEKTYEGEDIIYTIQNLKTNINLFLNNENYDIKNIISDIEEPRHKIKLEIYKNIGEIWTENRLNMLFYFLNEIKNKENKDDIASLIKALTTFMEYIDLCTKTTVNLLK